MKMRLQRKLYKGPFKIFGFRITAVLQETADIDTLIDQFADLLDCNGIFYWGMLGVGKIEGCVELGSNAPDLGEKRQVMIDWLDNCNEIISVEAGSIADLYYSKDLLPSLFERLEELAQICYLFMIPQHGR